MAGRTVPLSVHSQRETWTNFFWLGLQVFLAYMYLTQVLRMKIQCSQTQQEGIFPIGSAYNPSSDPCSKFKWPRPSTQYNLIGQELSSPWFCRGKDTQKRKRLISVLSDRQTVLIGYTISTTGADTQRGNRQPILQAAKMAQPQTDDKVEDV
ncbi:hypothetical protein BO78DRAFT_412826 [Aspergillus sclerotiicarbonarius CBS 121057]|uniref:Uncharacterized protein n=1 Tax=Aspergillus sclerotiicarbonarius (strain CBS 121057 / IBT 28362) TaxID=1448318 RepID=A0A319EVY8_ASPSB|nr:hypothetical protein BO78DRAFT_412826 [Aspergillus sclerotiicarbonarius CBS 121057]